MMKRYLFIKFTFISLFLIVSGVNVQAQQVLTLEEAVSIGWRRIMVYKLAVTFRKKRKITEH
jgi:hypothetical protein